MARLWIGRHSKPLVRKGLAGPAQLQIHPCCLRESIGTSLVTKGTSLEFSVQLT